MAQSSFTYVTNLNVPTKRPRVHPSFIFTTTATTTIATTTTVTAVASTYTCASSFVKSLPCSSSTFLYSPLRSSRLFPHNFSSISSFPPTTIKTTIITCAASDQLRQNLTDVPDQIIRAVESLSRRQPRQTVADISAAAGMSVSSVTDKAVTLAALTNAAIDVSESGEIAYRFPSDVRAKLRARSFRAMLAMTWRRISPALYTATRVAFGALLIISIVITFVAIAVLSAAGSGSRDDDRRDRSSSFVAGPRLFFGPDLFDIMFYSQRYGRMNSMSQRNNNEMSFLEAVYSFVFGDGDPNADFEDQRWRSVATVIRANRGAVTADQLAPLLDPSQNNRNESTTTNIVDEGFMLPALTRFQGHPEVTDDGDIVYVFPSFMTTGARGSVEIVGERSLVTSPAIEREETLTRASPSQRALVVTLGVVNFLGVAILGAKLATVIPVTRDAAQFISFVQSIYPALCTYAASFVAAPIFRSLRMRKRNRDIRNRNNARTQRSQVLARRDSNVTRKLRAAEQFVVRQNTVSSEDVVYSSDRDVIDQIKAQEEMKDDFDRRLNA